VIDKDKKKHIIKERCTFKYAGRYLIGEYIMQYVKDEIRQRIIDVAREEFIDKGFEKASIRTIAAKAKTAKSNLYNYFKDKDDLFRAVLEPTTGEIRNGLEMAKQYNMPKDAEDYTFLSQQLVIDAIINFIAQHVPEVKILLFKAQGSSLENFKYELLDAFTYNMILWTKSIHSKNSVSRLIIRTVCGFYLNMIEQIMLSPPPTDTEMAKYMKEISVFVYNGWKSVFADKER
jgi:AcrR family transcriptional regulator